MRVVAFVLALVALAPAWAAAYPEREVEFIVSFPTGGPADAAARIIAPKVMAALGGNQASVVVNKAGGGGSIGADYVAKAKPDGYTVYASTNSVQTINPVILQDVPYKQSDFRAIGAFAVDLGVITAKAGSPYKTLEEFVDYAKKNPGKLTYGSAGLGTVSFFTMEMFKQAYNLDIAHVPFQGTGPVKNAIMGGHVALATSGFGSLAPLIRSGDLIPLVTTSPRRVAAFPGVPTMAEKGFPDASINIWCGLYVPAKTPPPVVDVLVKALAVAVKDPAAIGAMEKAGMQMEYHSPDDTQRLLESESATVRKVATKLGMTGK
jgi:tripartite-type tricarboxylate transporter receptor subunit TctC